MCSTSWMDHLESSVLITWAFFYHSLKLIHHNGVLTKKKNGMTYVLRRLRTIRMASGGVSTISSQCQRKRKLWDEGLACHFRAVQVCVYVVS